MNLWHTSKAICSSFSTAFGVPSINTVTPPVLAALFVHGSSVKISGSIKRQKTGWEATSLTELVTIAEDFERTLEPDHKQKSAKLLALQLQGQRPKQHPGLQHCASLGARYQNSGPKTDVSAVINWGTGKEIVLNGPMQILLKCPHTYLQRGASHG